MRQYFNNIEEFERLARNRPHPNIAKELPKTTDGTLAAIVQEQPKRIVQQTPTGVVTCPDYPELAEVASYVLTEQLLPLSNTMGNVLQKSWNMIGKALTYGVQPSYTYFTKTGERFHTDFVLPYIRDLFIEKGKVFAPDANILFMRSWYTKRDIEGIIKKEKRLKEKDDDYKSEWDLKVLQELLDAGEGDTKRYATPTEREKGATRGGIEIIHAFQKGIGEKFFSFSPALDDNKVVRTKVNPDPRGNMPINFLYCNIDLSNPLGRGAVEMSGGIQNLIDHQMVMFQFLSTMMMGPPLQVWGSVNKSSLKFIPNALWDMGNNPQNKVEPYSINNAAITNFPNNYGLLKSQLLNLNSSVDTSISAESGNPGFSKTPTGIKANEARLNVSDNYMRKQFESWFGDQSETAINIFFSEMEGNGDLELTDDAIKQLSDKTLKKYLNKDGTKLIVPYSKVKDTVFKFQVDASSSEVKENSENIDKLTTVLELMMKVPDPMVQSQIPRLVKVIVNEIGAEGTDDLFPEPDSDQVDPATGLPMQQGAPLQAQPQPIAPPPPPPPPDAPLQPEEQQVVEALLHQGFSDDDAEQAIIMLRQGVPQDQILGALQAKRGALA